MLTKITEGKQRTTQLHCVACILDMPERQEAEMRQRRDLSGSKSTRSLPHEPDEQQIGRLQRLQLGDVGLALMLPGTPSPQRPPPRDCSINERRKRLSLRYNDRACTRTDEVGNS